MLVKFTEALVRIFGRVGFDRSRRPVDSGLVGALGTLGCCSTRKEGHARRPYKISEVRESYTIRDSGSFIPPVASYAQPVKGSASSHHSGPPASVLRPEHALRPYREDSDEDDDSAHIMSAWQPFPGPGNRVSYDRAESSPRTQTSGFSRVGGGRAHFDSPYAIAGGKEGSTLTFPSVERRGSGPGESPMVVPREEEAPTPTTSVANVARMPVLTKAGLPAGRTMSQTAIIVGELAAIAVASSTEPESHPLVEAAEKGSCGDNGNVANVDSGQPRKKHWFNIRRHRRHSDGLVLNDVEEGDNAVASSSKEPGRSFVVIRDRRPMTSRPELKPGQKPRQSLDESSRTSFAGKRGANS